MGSDSQLFQNLAIAPFKVSVYFHILYIFTSCARAYQVTVTYTTVIAGPYDLSSVVGSMVESILQISGTFTNGVIPIKYVVMSV